MICLNLFLSKSNPVSSLNSLFAASSNSSNFSNQPPGNPNNSFSFLFPINNFCSIGSIKKMPIPMPTSFFIL